MAKRLSRLSIVVFVSFVLVMAMMIGVATTNRATKTDNLLTAMAEEIYHVSGIPEANGDCNMSEFNVSLDTVKISLAAVDIPINGIDLRVGQTLPKGLTYNAETKVITGTPTEVCGGRSVMFDASIEGDIIVEFNVIFNIYEQISPSKVTLNMDFIRYNGMEHKPIVTVRNGTDMTVDESFYDVTYRRGLEITSNFTDIGDIAIDIDMRLPYVGSFDKTFKIQTNVNDNIIINNIPQIEATYDIDYDKNFSDISATLGGAPQIIVGVDIKNSLDLPNGLTYANTRIMGIPKEICDKDITFIIRLESGYIKEFPINFKVKRRALNNMNATISFTSRDYDGSELKPIITVTTPNDQILVSGTDYSEEYFVKKSGAYIPATEFANVGDYEIVIRILGNYSGIINKFYSITPEQVNDSAVGDIEDCEYDGNPHKVKPIIDEAYNSADYEMTFYRDGEQTFDFTKIGVITVKIRFKGNYQGNIEKSYTIKRIEVSESDINVSENVVYSGIQSKPIITVPKWRMGEDYTVQYFRDDESTEDFVNSGIISIVITFKGNLEGVFKYSYIIEPKTVTNINLGSIPNSVEDGSDKTPTLVINTIYNKGTDYDVSYYRNEEITEDLTTHGEIIIKVVMKGNYRGEASVKYIILPSSQAVGNADNILANIYSKDGFALGSEFAFAKLSESTLTYRLGEGERVAAVINLTMTNNGEMSELLNKATVKIKLPLDKTVAGVRVEYIERGSQNSRRAEIDSEGYLTFDIYSTGEILIIVKDVEDSGFSLITWLTVGGIVAGVLALIIIVVFILYKNNGIRTIMPKRKK